MEIYQGLHKYLLLILPITCLPVLLRAFRIREDAQTIDALTIFSLVLFLFRVEVKTFNVPIEKQLSD